MTKTTHQRDTNHYDAYSFYCYSSLALINYPELVERTDSLVRIKSL